MRDQRVHIGTVSVDTGELLLVDPCYIRGKMLTADDGEGDKMLPIEEQPFPAAERTTGRWVEGGITFPTGFGDGVYDVYATISDEGTWGKRVRKVEIIFMEDEESSDDDD